MMDWLYISLLSYLVFAILGVIEGVGVKKYFKNPFVFLMLNLFFQGLLGSLVFLFKPIYIYDITLIFLTGLAGIIYSIAFIPYIYALKNEEVSRINPLFNLTPILVFFFSVLFLKTKYTYFAILGTFLLIMGSFFLFFKNDGKIHLNKYSFYMVITTTLIATYFILMEYIFRMYDFWSAFFLVSIFVLIMTTFLLIKPILKKDLNKKGFVLAILVGSFAFIGTILRTYVFKLIPSSFYSAMSGFQTIFLMLILFFISKKGVLKEDFKGKILYFKILAVLFFVLGLYFIR